MTDVLQITGTLATTPTNSSGSGLSSVLAQLAESLVLQTKSIPGEYDLTSDAAADVSLGSLTGVNVLFIKSTAKVRVRVTSADGSQQAWPVDTVLLLISESVDITAIDITREAGVETFVNIVLGQSAS